MALITFIFDRFARGQELTIINASFKFWVCSNIYIKSDIKDLSDGHFVLKCMTQIARRESAM